MDEACGLPAAEAVQEISLRKARAVSRLFPDSFVLAADTLVSVNGIPLGKPAGADDAVRMLKMLTGNTHQVFSGVTVISPSGSVYTGYDRTEVTFIPVCDEEIRAYVATGEPMDKAGSYALQGRAGTWVRRLEGSDTSVIGLPLCLVRNLLTEAGFPLYPAPETQTV